MEVIIESNATTPTERLIEAFLGVAADKRVAWWCESGDEGDVWFALRDYVRGVEDRRYPFVGQSVCLWCDGWSRTVVVDLV